jgi:hypothetical protein
VKRQDESRVVEKRILDGVDQKRAIEKQNDERLSVKRQDESRVVEKRILDGADQKRAIEKQNDERLSVKRQDESRAVAERKLDAQEGIPGTLERQRTKASRDDRTLPALPTDGALCIPLSPSPAEKAEMLALLAERGHFIERRDSLQSVKSRQTLTSDERQELRAARRQINERSRQLGELSAQLYMESVGAHGDIELLYPRDKGHPSRAREFDQIWRCGDELVIVEAKGGRNGDLKWAKATPGVEAQQGSPTDFEKVAANKKSTNTRVGAESLDSLLLRAWSERKLKFIRVWFPIRHKSASDQVVVSEYRLWDDQAEAELRRKILQLRTAAQGEDPV